MYNLFISKKMERMKNISAKLLECEYSSENNSIAA